jgi:hypothetical protein
MCHANKSALTPLSKPLSCSPTVKLARAAAAIQWTRSSRMEKKSLVGVPTGWDCNLNRNLYSLLHCNMALAVPTIGTEHSLQRRNCTICFCKTQTPGRGNWFSDQGQVNTIHDELDRCGRSFETQVHRKYVSSCNDLVHQAVHKPVVRQRHSSNTRYQYNHSITARFILRRTSMCCKSMPKGTITRSCRVETRHGTSPTTVCTLRALGRRRSGNTLVASQWVYRQ